MVEAFLKAACPVNVFDNPHVREWIHTHVKDGINLPSVSTLRRKVNVIGEKDLQKTIDICK